MVKASIKGAARRASMQDSKARRDLAKQRKVKNEKWSDSLVNFAQNLGIGADNALTTATYGFNPITRIRILLEWIHRGSWIGGLIVDLVADDMTREGLDLGSDMDPTDSEKTAKAIITTGLWRALNDATKWARLYGGALVVPMIDGQDTKYPLRIETVSKGRLKGFIVLDRWQVDPSLNDLVTEFGPDFGMPKFYRTATDAPGVPKMTIHHSRVMRLEGIRLPYNQRLVENLWGLSVLERVYDRMVGADSATTGISQTVYKAYLRTLSVKGLRNIVAHGGEPMKGLVRTIEFMRRYQSMEGISVIDGDDKFEIQQNSAFSGLAEAALQLLQQLSGAAQIPLVRFLGQSPAGLNSTGESDLRNYYDNIKKEQDYQYRPGLMKMVPLIMLSEGIKIPENFWFEFAPLWQMSEKEKAEVAKADTDRVVVAAEAGIVTNLATLLKELKQAGRPTGRWTNITNDQIEAAEDEDIAPAPAPGTGEEGDEGDDEDKQEAAE